MAIYWVSYTECSFVTESVCAESEAEAKQAVIDEYEDNDDGVFVDEDSIVVRKGK